MSCQFCGKQFNRGFNLRRHEKEYCARRDQQRNMSGLGSQVDEDDVFTASTERSEETEDESAETDEETENESETEEETENESETEEETENESEEETDPWMPMVEEAMDKNRMSFEEMKQNFLNSGFDEDSASDKAYSAILPKIQNELERIYMERLMWMKQLKKDPVHRKIMHTKNTLVENDDFDPEEAPVVSRGSF